MGATLIVDDLELATVLSGTHFLTSEGWKPELTQQRKDIMRSVGMTTMGIQTGVARMVAKQLTHYVYLLLKAAIVKLFGKLSEILGRIPTFYFYQGFFQNIVTDLLLR